MKVGDIEVRAVPLPPDQVKGPQVGLIVSSGFFTKKLNVPAQTVRELILMLQAAAAVSEGKP